MRAAILVATAVAACVPSARATRAPVDRLLAERLGVEARPADTAALAAAPLTRASTVRLALARHPRVAAAFAQLGVAAGETAALRGLGTTDVDVSWKVAGAEPSFELEVVHDVLDAFLASPRRAAGAAGLDAARARAAATVIGVAARAELAFLDVAAATEQLAQARTAFDTVAASAELTARIHAAGGTHDLALVRAQAARETARVDVARAEVALELARTGLDGAAGMSGADTGWRLGEGLPALPEAAPALDDLEAEAITASLELVALGADRTAAANAARAAAVERWLPGLGVGVAVEHSEHGTSYGPALRVGLPFLSGGGEVAAARARGAVGEHLVTAAAIELRAQARAARLDALGAYAEARQLRDVVVPLHRRLVEETVLQYNAMNASPFELLVARRELATAEQALIAAQLRFARAMVAAETLRRGATVAIEPSTASPAPRPAAAGH